MVLAVLCDGMGGYDKGEVASAAVINAFTDWMNTCLSVLSQSRIEDHVIRQQWDEIVSLQNKKIKEYGDKLGITLGTTVTALLITDSRYYIMNVGDGRVYEISESLKQITDDQTVVASDVANGLMTQEQADADPRRNVLRQAVGASGASDEIVPDFFFGEPTLNAVYMLCSDGFRHEIKPHEIYNAFHPLQMTNTEQMKMQTDGLIEANKQRNEEDNISVITIRTF
jgi:serine/threonine protein phosphatase PrpC